MVEVRAAQMKHATTGRTVKAAAATAVTATAATTAAAAAAAEAAAAAAAATAAAATVLELGPVLRAPRGWGAKARPLWCVSHLSFGSAGGRAVQGLMPGPWLAVAA